MRSIAMAACAVASMALVGCDDDGGGNSGAIDGGGNGDDGGTTGDEDAGGGSKADKMCGVNECNNFSGGALVLEACCYGDDKDICGLNTDPIAMTAGTLGGGGPLGGDCQLADAPGEDNEVTCGALFDFIDGDTEADKANGRFDLSLNDCDDPDADPTVISMPGCCTPTGVCGVAMDGTELGGAPLPLGLGCVSFLEFAGGLAADPSADPNACKQVDLNIDPAAFMEPDAPAVFCVAEEDGKPVKDGGPACVPNLDLFGTQLTDWQCTATGLPGADGEPNTVEGCMAGLPALACGCGTGEQPTYDVTGPDDGDDFNNCVPNVRADACGCDTSGYAGADGEVGTADDCVADLPGQAQGCGVGMFPTVDVTVGDFDDGVDAFNNCYPNVPAGVYGCGPLLGLPSILCGCGEDVAVPWMSGDDPGCLPNTPAVKCGTEEINLGLTPDAADHTGDGQGDSACLMALPAVVCGCGEGVAAPDAVSCLSNTATDLCGCNLTGLPIPSDACGCGFGVTTAWQTPGGEDGCIPNVPLNVCGEGASVLTEVPNGADHSGDDLVGDAVCLAEAPAVVCGCGVGTGSATGQDCLSNKAADVCGCTLTGLPIPSNACGCGYEVDTAFQVQTQTGPVDGCLPNVPRNVCGTAASTLSVITNGIGGDTDCFAGVPNIACGCGTDIGSADGQCLSNSTLCGCVEACTHSGNPADSTCGQGFTCLDISPPGAGGPPGDGVNDLCAPDQ